MRTHSRRALPESGLFATERPPRLVLRFAIVLSLTFAAASAVILVLVHEFAITEAERAATRHASIVAATLLQQTVEPADLERPVGARRKRELDAVFRSTLYRADDLRVSLVRRDGLVTYSSARVRIGTRAWPDMAAEGARGFVVSRVADEGAGTPARALVTFAPVGRDVRTGAAQLVQPYRPIEQAARRAQIRIGAVLEGLLVVLFIIFVPLLARVTRRIARQLERIHEQAYYDELTRLPNRVHLFERLDAALTRSGNERRRLAVLLLDIDHFREINDTLGHEAGDLLLAHVAARLDDAVAPGTLLARLGGDEFAAVVEWRESQDEVHSLGERLRAEVERPVEIADVPLAVEATVGIAFHPQDGTDAETLLRHAEVATYAAKDWKTGVLAYSPTVDPHDPEQLALVAALKQATERDELVLHYQPKIALATGSVMGFEALAYWKHPTRGLLPPRAFVPVAERTGVIRHLSRAVLGQAVRQLSSWQELEHELCVAVNLTAVDLLDVDLPGELECLLDEHGVDPRRLTVEVTETTVMADPERARATLERIVSTGVRASIDDFGTGHSSLAYLKHLPVSEVKIDRSFVAALTASPHDRLIVHAMIELGHNLGLDVVAEGVETHELEAALRALGCDHAQGFLYSRPMPAKKAIALLRTWGDRPRTQGRPARRARAAGRKRRAA